MGDFATESSVQHHEHLELLDVVDEDLTKTVRQNMSGGLCISVADLWHLDLTLEAPSDTIVDTMRLPPVGLDDSKGYEESNWLVVSLMGDEEMAFREEAG